MTLDELHIAFKQGVDKSTSLEDIIFIEEEIDFWLNQSIRKFVKTRYSGTNYRGEAFEQSQKRIDDLRTLVREVRITPSVLSGNGDKPNSYEASLPPSYWFALGEEVTIGFTHACDGASTKRRGVTECTADTYREMIDDPLSEHILHYYDAQPLRLFQEGKVVLISDGNYTVDYYYLRYLKAPQEIDIQTDIANDSIEEGVKYEVRNTDSTYKVTYNGNDYFDGETFVGVSGVTTYTEPVGNSTVHVTIDMPEHTHDEIVVEAVNMALENIEQPRYQTHSVEQTMIE